MLKEKIKSTVIILLIINMFYITTQLWFIQSYSTVGKNLMGYIRNVPLINKLIPIDEEYSVPKENLSLPRKILINDGSLWTVYYNTDIGFSPIEQRTRSIISGFLNGEITTKKEIDNITWEAGLESLSIYVEYPISFSMEMFCRSIGADVKDAPTDIKNIRDFIILPSSDDTQVCLLMRDNSENPVYYAYILSNKYQFPAEDLVVYTSSSEERCEPAFSTGLLLDEENPVSLSPLVLFSDSKPENTVLYPVSLINESSKELLLENFSFNYQTVNHYRSNDGTENYIENYGSIRFYPDSIFEYTSVSDDKGIVLDESGNAFNALNNAIDFAEKTWECVSNEQFNVLVTSDLSDYDSESPYTFKFNYYYDGRPVEIDIEENYGHSKMRCSVEATLLRGRLISYRQYMCSYNSASDMQISDDFLTALDSFINTIPAKNDSHVVINDIYIGYLDDGKSDKLQARWLAKVKGNSKIYCYSSENEVIS